LSQIVKIGSAESRREAIVEAMRILSEGGVIGVPTESFYGLCADATNPQAIGRIFAIKKRDAALPILILISSLEELEKYAQSVPPQAKRMGQRFWPGGLTMIFQSSPLLPPILTGTTGKVGIRISGHPIAQTLCEAFQRPITGTSANISGMPPCTTVDQVIKYLGDEVDLVLDGGPTEGKNPSTILDVTTDPPVILREGIIRAEEIIESDIYKGITVSA
jgi:L-threonylcarbamoyladenylate synthase